MKLYKQKTDPGTSLPNPVSAADALMAARAIAICSGLPFVGVSSFIRSLSEESLPVLIKTIQLITLTLILWDTHWGRKASSPIQIKRHSLQ
jgi:hypothetical protein